MWVVGALLFGSAFKNEEEKANNPARDNNADVFSKKYLKNIRKFGKLHISDKNGPKSTLLCKYTGVRRYRCEPYVTYVLINGAVSYAW